MRDVARADRAGARIRALTCLLHCGEAEIEHHRDERGKPLLRRPTDAAYSVSYCEELSLMLVGTAWRLEVGVDLHAISDRIPSLGIADAVFDPLEAAFLRRLPERRTAIVFGALWTIKEAVLKACGRGIARGMSWPRVDGGTLIAALDQQDPLDVDLQMKGHSNLRVNFMTLDLDNQIVAVARATVPNAKALETEPVIEWIITCR